MKELVTPFIRAFPLAALALVALPARAADTRGHGTTGNAALWKRHLADLLQRAPRMGK
jgi:hypothetical protein